LVELRGREEKSGEGRSQVRCGGLERGVAGETGMLGETAL
jgi:hypothetical protein